MKIQDTRAWRMRVRNCFRPVRIFTAAQQQALDEWATASDTECMRAPLVIRYSRPDLTSPRYELNDPLLAQVRPLPNPEDSWISGMVSGGICAGFFSVNPSVHCAATISSSPMGAMVVAAAISDVSLWCMEIAAVLEAAAISAGIPARNTSGASGLTDVMVRKRLMPALPVPYPENH